MSAQTVASVQKVDIIDNSTASIVQFGDRKTTKLLSYEIAVLQNQTSYFAGEPNFLNYTMFTKPIPTTSLPLHSAHIIEKPSNTCLAPLPLLCTAIEIDSIKIISSSNSSNIQFGNGIRFLAEERAKSFKQYFC